MISGSIILSVYGEKVSSGKDSNRNVWNIRLHLLKSWGRQSVQNAVTAVKQENTVGMVFDAGNVGMKLIRSTMQPGTP